VGGAIAALAAATAIRVSKPPAMSPHRLVLKELIKALLLVLIRRQQSWRWRLSLCCGSGCAKELGASWLLELNLELCNCHWLGGLGELWPHGGTILLRMSKDV
jgi:hypothetical protein